MRGRTTVVIAHRLSTVIGADLICIMDRGRIVETGPADEVMRTPKDPYTAALLSAVPTVDGPPRKRPGGLSPLGRSG
jgi:ABC-type oligopeptide transport system ATPase subunit